MLKKTKQKEAILRVLKGTLSHPTADWIYNEVRKEIPSVSLGTIYRNLKLLREQGEILELDLSGTLSRFDANAENHYHFRCESCGNVFDVDMPVIQELNEIVALETGFEIMHHRLEFRGLCNQCHRTEGRIN